MYFYVSGKIVCIGKDELGECIVCCALVWSGLYSCVNAHTLYSTMCKQVHAQAIRLLGDA